MPLKSSDTAAMCRASPDSRLRRIRTTGSDRREKAISLPTIVASRFTYHKRMNRCLRHAQATMTLNRRNDTFVLFARLSGAYNASVLYNLLAAPREVVAHLTV